MRDPFLPNRPEVGCRHNRRSKQNGGRGKCKTLTCGKGREGWVLGMVLGREGRRNIFERNEDEKREGGGRIGVGGWEQRVGKKNELSYHRLESVKTNEE